MFGRLFSPKPDAPQHIELEHAGQPLRVRLKRVAGARKFTLRVRSAQRDVVLTVPARSNLHAARDFAMRHAGWIEARLKKLAKPVSLEVGQVIPLRGVDHLITHRPGVRKTVWIEAGTVHAPMLLCVAGESAHVGRRVRDYLKREARRELEAAVLYHSRKLGKTVTRITLRDTTSRWGSCSSRGSLNFSWRLILAPGFVLDYLAAHEVAHLVHMDHSPRFWSVTRQLVPDFERAEAWLKTHGAALHRFDSAAEPAG